MPCCAASLVVSEEVRRKAGAAVLVGVRRRRALFCRSASVLFGCRRVGDKQIAAALEVAPRMRGAVAGPVLLSLASEGRFAGMRLGRPHSDDLPCISDLRKPPQSIPTTATQWSNA